MVTEYKPPTAAVTQDRTKFAKENPVTARALQVPTGALAAMLPSPLTIEDRPNAGTLEKVSNRIETWRPNFINNLVGAVGAGTSIFTGKKPAWEGNAAKLGDAGELRANDITGVLPPKDVIDMGLRITGESIPGAVSVALNAVTKIGKVLGTAGTIAIPTALVDNVMEYLDVPNDLYQSTYDLIGWEFPIDKYAEDTYEAVTTQDLSKLPKETKDEAVVTIDEIEETGVAGVDYTRDTVLDDPTDPIEAYEKQQALDPIAEYEQRIEADPIAAFELSQDPIAAFEAKQNEVITLEDESDAWKYATAGLFVASLFAGAAARRKILKQVGQLTEPDTFLHGQKKVPSIISTRAKTETALVNKHATLYEPIAKAFGKDSDEYLDFESLVNTTADFQPMTARIYDFNVTGQYPHSTIKGQRLDVIMQVRSKISPEQDKLVNEILGARNALDDMKINNKTVWTNAIDPTKTRTREALELVGNQPINDKAVQWLVDATSKFYSKTPDYLYENGIIPLSMKEFMQTNRKNFVHTGINFDESTPMTNVFKQTEADLGSGGMFEGLAKRSVENGVAPGEGYKPLDLLEVYSQQLIRYTENNRMRKEFLELALQSGDYKNAIKVVKKPSKSNPNIVTYLKNGKAIHVQVDDVDLRLALKFTPDKVDKFLSGMTSVANAFTTGIINVFAPVAATLEVTAAIPLRPVGTKLGKGFLVSPITGTVRSVSSDAARSISRNLEASLVNDGYFVKTFGAENTAKLARIMTRAYENSLQRMVDRNGSGYAAYTTSVLDSQQGTQMQRLAPSLVKRMTTNGWSRAKALPILRQYVLINKAMYGSVRHQYFGKNRIKKNKNMTQAEIDQHNQRIASKTNNLTGNFANSGRAGTLSEAGTMVEKAGALVGKTNKYGTTTVQYLNIFEQVMAQTARALSTKEGRRIFFTGMATVSIGSVGIMAAQLTNKENRAEFLSRTAGQRATSIVIYGKPGEVILELPIDHQARPFYSPFMESFLTVFGYKNDTAEFLGDSIAEGDFSAVYNLISENLNGWSEENSRDVYDGLNRSMQTYLPDLVPVPVNMFAGAVTGENLSAGFGRFGAEKQPKDKSDIGQLTRADTNAIQQRITAILNSQLGATMKAVQTGAEAWVNERGNGADLLQSMQTAASVAGYIQSERVPFKSSLWGAETFEKRMSLQDAAGSLVYDKGLAISDMRKRYTMQVRSEGQSSVSGRSPTINFTVTESLRGTPAGEIISRTAQLDGSLRFLRSDIKNIKMQIQSDKNNPTYLRNFTLLRERENDAIEEIRLINKIMLQKIQLVEDGITNSMGKPFQFDDFEVDDWK